MKLHKTLIVSLVLCAVGCAEKTEPPPETMTEAEAPAADAAVAINEIWQSEAFIAHMHEHAEKLDELNFALADDDLDLAKELANWLATHDTDSNIEPDWMPYLYRMRTEAEAVEAAPDVATARAAAERITVQCQECHAAVGIGAD